MPDSDHKWYVVYTKPRWEKKVYNLLIAAGIEAYCPLNRTRKKWSDRIKWVEEPLFKSYIFVKVADDQRSDVRMVDGVVNYVYWLGKPAIVKEKEIETIRKFLNDYEEVQALPIDLSTNMAVTIRQGIFMDREAKVIKVVNNKVQVIIESIGYSLVATVNRSNLVVKRTH
ncbi:MAG TPA: UpxY family transcription antiterminator [Puia sp.]|nr:UpxY family transcription antiterminator [Puia sp.]